MSKVDVKLGQQVKSYLIEKGVETPLITNTEMLPEHKKDIIAKNFKEIMETLGLDLNDDSLADTPNRVAKMYVDEIYCGLDYNNFPKCTAVENKMGYDEMLIEKDVTSMSSCEHHFVTIDGKAKVAYIPKDKVIGLSKINRIVDFFSRRPQIQERLTEQIFHTLCFILGTEDVAVSLTATHYCVKSRGIKDLTSYTTTNKLGGCFKESSVRAEFFNS